MRALLCSLVLISPALAQDKAAESARPWGPPAIARTPASAPARAAGSILTLESAAAGSATLRLNDPALREAAATPGPFTISAFPLSPTLSADLRVERFWVTAPGMRFVAGPEQRPIDFDPDSIVLLRGEVVGHPNSRVFLALGGPTANGIIDFGPGRPTFGLSSRTALGTDHPGGSLTVFPANPAPGPSPSTLCHHPSNPVEPPAPAGPDTEIRKGLRRVQIAIETDNEFFTLFPSEAAAAAYVVQLYGAVSDIFMRELNVRLDITYSRLWPQPNEPFVAGLDGFRNYWLANMQAVPRDSAQMFSGRADLPGGVAYLNSICNNTAYSFCGNLVGYFADPLSSSVLNYDPLVAAHEFGHNFGSSHTHDYNLDNCNVVAATPQRGTIMAYCNQTVSGAMAVEDLTFHTVTRAAMMEYIPTRTCVVFDCNQNGRSDALDISLASSADTNANGIPDECEDCNGNSVLDPVDIGLGTSLDLNSNGVPDECEPDCNNNNVPDDRDILLGTSLDPRGDGIPDECEADLNANNISDLNEIHANMMLDRNRNRTLDAVEDCNNNAVPDLTDLDGAHDAWTASLAAENAIRRFHSITGVLMATSPTGQVAQAQDLVITPTRRILVSSASGNRVVEFTRTGAFVGNLVPAGAGGLANPAQMLLTPAGTLLVASRGNNAVLEYNLTTGAFIRQFVASGSGGLTSPFGLALGPSGNLFVSSSASNQVFEYNGTTGAFVRILVTTAGNGGLSGARGLLFKPDGNLLVASFNTDQVKHYNGVTGAYLGDWLVTGLGIDGPWCLRMGRDGMVYISRSIDHVDTHVTRARIFIHDPRNGYFVRAYVQGQDSGLSMPTGFDFMPGEATDCNFNQVLDACDIASGFSTDLNNNGKPDECERDCYANCDLSTTPPVLNVQDFSCFLNQFASGGSYANCDGSTVAPVLNIQDFACFLNRFAAGCP